jgi:hypothetical protein
VEVIGNAGDDHAVAVGFEDGTTAWFDATLVTVIDVNAGQVAVVGNRRFVRQADGGWVEAPGSD